MHDKKWQYKVETIKTSPFTTADKTDSKIQERLNRLGLEGWELVNVSHDGMYHRIHLKK